jgi:Sel1 repeat
MGPTAVVRCVACGHENNSQYRYCGMCGAALPQEPAADRTAQPKPAQPSSVPPRPARSTSVPPRPAPPSAAPQRIAPLSSAASTSSPPGPKAPPLAVGGYSILGLEEEPDRRVPGREAQPRQEVRHTVDYLLEDDEDVPRPHRWHFYAVLVLLLICAGALVREWQLNGYPEFVLSLVAAVRGKTATATSAAPSSAASAPSNPAEAASGNESAPPAQANPSDKPSPGTAAPVAATEPVRAVAASTAPVAEPPAGTTAPEKAPAAAPSATAATPPSAAPTSAPAPAEAAPESAAPQPAASQPTASQPAASTPQPETKQPAATPAPAEAQAAATETATAPAETTTAETRSAPEAAQPASPPVSSADRLLAAGTKYLYGDGVEQNCDLAQKNLRLAAASSAEAESLLGTMFASGHCVARDLPTAYRWYARALHREPENKRYQSDLVVLWNQMTPAERRLVAGK